MKSIKKIINSIIKEYLNENRNILNKDILPNYLYHVTTNYNDVIKSGILLAKSGLDSGGLGGTESIGVSFVSDINIAKNIYNELNLINNINNSKNEKKFLKIINNIDDGERKNLY